MLVFSIGCIGLGVGEYCIVDYMVNGCSCMIFLVFFTNSNHFPYFSVKHLGSRPITKEIAMSSSFSPALMMSG